jgi:hypothetical protein
MRWRSALPAAARLAFTSASSVWAAVVLAVLVAGAGVLCWRFAESC